MGQPDAAPSRATAPSCLARELGGANRTKGAEIVGDRLAHVAVAHEVPVVKPRKVALLGPVEAGDRRPALVAVLVPVDDERGARQLRDRDAAFTLSSGE